MARSTSATDTESAPEWRRHLNKRFRDTATYAAQRSPFWQDYANKIDLEKFNLFEDPLPLIQSSTVRANQPPATDDYRLILGGINGKSVYQSSGTTGVPKTVAYSTDDWDRDMSRIVARMLSLAGVMEEDVIANQFPRVGPNLSGPGNDAGIRELGAGLVSFASNCSCDEYYKGFQNHSVTVVEGLTSHMEALGRQFQEQGYDMTELDIHIIITAGENSTRKKRDWICNRFDAERVVDFYGSTEFGCSGVEAANGNMDFFEDQVHVAAYDADGNKLSDGEEGYLVFSYLKEEDQDLAMPLLGFEIGDYGKVVERQKQRDGYWMTEVDIYGKSRDEFTVGAVDLRPAFFETAIRDFSDQDELTGEFQVLIEENREQGSEMTLVVETAMAVPSSYEEKLRQHIVSLHPYLDDTINRGGVTFSIEMTQEIDLGRGKPSRVIDNRR